MILWDGVIVSLGHINAPRNPDIRMQAKTVNADIEPASGIQLSNYPNPFNPSTQINFVLPKKAFVELKVYDVLGRQVADLLNEVREAGSHKVLFNASYLSSGVYLYQLRSGSTVITNKFMLIK